MKKWFLFLLLLVCYTLNNSTVKADTNYKAFEEIELKTGKFLHDYSKSELKTYMKKVEKRKFIGWRIYEVHSNLPVSYKTETLFSYFNDGTTPITYDYSVKRKSSSSISLSSTGSIGLDLSGTVDKFKGGLNSSLKITNTEKIDEDFQEDFKTKVIVDPGTMLNLYILGEGTITNGVACYFFFWIKGSKGGYEIFTKTTQYYRLEKIRV